MPRHRKALGACLTLFASLACAAPVEGPISVSADSGRFEQEAGTGVYSGNVELLQGNRTMKAEKMSLFTSNGELTRVEAAGNPVQLSEGKDLEAHANNLVYDIKARTLVLTGDAFIRHKGNTFEGAKVEYSLDSKRVDASSEGDQRVRLVIPAENQIPGNEQQDNPDAEPTTP
ncbi:lipopolysaccharide transport periplasmic protein LptA [Alcanivorax sp. S6407]|uniref:lipopolysaccharide transport periplasmic protein LptA n=1 Tax=Alcanivorax sp. S6407 TaxID=2926424 RepID=UPI001FF3BE86|nr:lipopolysaccharide transport periplasmic protein LptA [Alcanivorax sp. S6407]MCK0154988.1 lipopolysaccharide transport periplasmic protein LptA [Alcanivorax sp. S6407]